MNFSLDFYYPQNRIELEIKKDAEHFVVEEISEFGLISRNVDCGIFKETEGKFTWFVLKKKNWPTDKAIRAIAKYLRVSHKRFNWAGTKDKKAITTQLCSAFALDKERLLSVKIKDIEIPCAFTMPDKIKLGSLKGNRFHISMNKEHYEHFESNLVGLFPNYYGMQRFGIRKHSHKIGYYFLKEEYEEAMYLFLTDTSYEINPKAVDARNKLKEHLDFKKAFEEFPKHLYLERMLLNHLKDHPRDYVNAFRKLPRATLLTFVHAFQSYVFNQEISIRFKEQGYEIKKEENEYYVKKDKFGFPVVNEKSDKGEFVAGNVVGYESELNSYEEEILEKYSVSKSDFKIASFPEVSVKGARRVLLSPIINPKFNEGFLSFSLQAGSYATTMLNNFFKTRINYNY